MLPPRDLALALLIISVWGVNFAVIKVGLGGVPPLLLGALRFVLAAVPVLWLAAPRIPLRLYLAYGMTISVGQFALLFTALHLGMPTGLASLVLQSQSLLTLVLAGVFLGERWRVHQVLGLVLAGIGLVTIGTAHGQSMPLVGFVLTVGAALSWAAGNVISRFLARYAPFNQLAFVGWASLVPIAPLLVLSLWLEGPQLIVHSLQNLGWTSLASVAYLAWVATLLGYGLWTTLMSRHPANSVAPFTLLVPVVGLTTGWLAFGETLQAVHVLGGALLITGVVVNLLGPQLAARWAQIRSSEQPSR